MIYLSYGHGDGDGAEDDDAVDLFGLPTLAMGSLMNVSPPPPPPRRV